MRKRILGILLGVAVLIGAPAVAGATTIVANISSVEGAGVSFNGGNFSFFGNFEITDFEIDDVLESSALGLLGSITNSYAIGAITTNGTLSTAGVTGQGQFRISDGVNLFTADLEWVDISQDGTGGSINTVGVVNLSNFVYAGPNLGLLALSGIGSGSVTASFQFDPAKTLSQLKTTGPYLTSYSGSLYATAPDGGATVGLLGLALVGLGFVRSRVRP